MRFNPRQNISNQLNPDDAISPWKCAQFATFDKLRRNVTSDSIDNRQHSACLHKSGFFASPVCSSVAMLSTLNYYVSVKTKNVRWKLMLPQVIAYFEHRCWFQRWLSHKRKKTSYLLDLFSLRYIFVCVFIFFFRILLCFSLWNPCEPIDAIVIQNIVEIIVNSFPSNLCLT